MLENRMAVSPPEPKRRSTNACSQCGELFNQLPNGGLHPHLKECSDAGCWSASCLACEPKCTCAGCGRAYCAKHLVRDEISEDLVCARCDRGAGSLAQASDRYAAACADTARMKEVG